MALRSPAVSVFRGGLLPGEDALAAINRILADAGPGEEQEALERLLSQLPSDEKYHQLRIEQGVSVLKEGLGEVYDLMSGIEGNLAEFESLPSVKSVQEQDSEMLDELAQIWKTKSNVEVIKVGLEKALELDSFADELTSCQEVIQTSQLRSLIQERSSIMSLAESLPESNHLKKTAQVVWEYLNGRLEDVFEPLLKEESAIYNPSTFSKDQVSTNITGVSNAVSDYFTICAEANCVDRFMANYCAPKLQLLKKRLFSTRPGDAREYLTGLGQAAQVFKRECTLLSKAFDNIQSSSDSMQRERTTKQFEQEVAKLYYLSLFELFEKSLELHGGDLAGKLLEELKRESVQTFWREVWELIVNSIQESGLQRIVSPGEYQMMVSVWSKPVHVLSDRVIQSVMEILNSLLVEKNKITELDEKLQSTQFDRYAVTLRYCLRLQCELGFGLNMTAWVKAATAFSKQAIKKLDECLRVYESYYFGGDGTNSAVRFDPYMNLDKVKLHRFVARDHKLSEIVQDLQPATVAFEGFTIQKKLINSLLQVLVNVFAEFVVFKNTVLEILGDLATGTPECVQKGTLLTAETRRVILLDGGDSQEQSGAQGALTTLAHALAGTESEFKRDLVSLMVKDSRDLVGKFFGQLESSGSSVAGDLDRVAGAFMSKLTQICEDHDVQVQRSYFAHRLQDWADYTGGGLRGTATADSWLGVQLLQDNAPSKLSGVFFWMELYAAAVFGFFFAKARSVADPRLLLLLERESQTLKGAAFKWLKYASVKSHQGAN